VFEQFRPGIDLHAEAGRMGEGPSDLVSLDDLYPDALPALRALRDAGYRLALAANQPAPAADVLRAIDVPIEFVATSAAWRVAKPDPAFFQRIIAELRLPPQEIAYVGDRLDNDIRPAAAAGMIAVFVRRGPWAWIQAGRTNPPEAGLTVESLAELPGALAARDAAGSS
jgi:HAD superfamily hydrolase (TIGR01662 family)